jgi:hypothetical protein
VCVPPTLAEYNILGQNNSGTADAAVIRGGRWSHGSIPDVHVCQCSPGLEVRLRGMQRVVHPAKFCKCDTALSVWGSRVGGRAVKV